MIMRLRQPRKGKFRSPLREKRRRQREYYYASISVLVVKIVLFVFLWILFSVSVKLFHYKFSHVIVPLRYAVPAIVAVFALVLGYFIILNIMELKGQREVKH